MIIGRHIYLIYTIIACAVVFIFIKPKRIIELLPVAALSAVILFLVEILLIKIEVYRFNNPILSIGGVPLFLLLWGAPSGMVVIQLMKQEFWKKFLAIILLSAAVVGLEAFTEYLGAASHLGRFNNVTEFFIDFITIVLLVWFSEGLWADRIYSGSK